MKKQLLKILQKIDNDPDQLLVFKFDKIPFINYNNSIDIQEKPLLSVITIHIIIIKRQLSTLIPIVGIGSPIVVHYQKSKKMT
jgi:hypothetical protein